MKITIVLILALIPFFISQQNYTNNIYIHSEKKIVTDEKTEALTVLENKCNACHSQKKRQQVFTLDNMDALALTIYDQVFIKKRMPKGRKIKLTEPEFDALKKWLNTINIPN